MRNRHLCRLLIPFAAKPPHRIAINGCQRIIDCHTSITIEPVTPIQVDVEGWHDDANEPKGYRRTILEPDVYQPKYRRQDVKPMLPDKLHHIKNLSIDAPSY